MKKYTLVQGSWYKVPKPKVYIYRYICSLGGLSDPMGPDRYVAYCSRYTIVHMYIRSRGRLPTEKNVLIYESYSYRSRAACSCLWLRLVVNLN